MLYSALLLGVLSSLHCIGMCGPIAMMLPLDRYNPAKKTLQLLLYHTGRITAYGTLGLLFGFLGRGLYLAGMQQQLSIIAGLFMIVIVMIPERLFARYNFSKPIYLVISKLKTSLGRQFKKSSYKVIFVTGLFNGFLPCGLVYVALFGAIAMQSIPSGVLYMILYGLGTVPLMSVVVYTSGLIKGSFRNSFSKIVPFVAVFIGMLFIARGLGLSITYVSPGTMSLYVQKESHCK